MSTHWLPIPSILFWIVTICRSLFKCSCVKNDKLFLNFLFHLWNLHQILKIFKEKNIVIANVFPKLRTVKDLVRLLSKKRRLKTSLDSEHVKESQKLVTSVWEHFYHIFLSVWGEMISKIAPLLKFQIIGIFVNTMTADYQCPVPDSKNFLFPIQIQLS